MVDFSVMQNLPLITFARNNGMNQMTGVASRYVGRIIAVMLVALGLFPMISGCSRPLFSYWSKTRSAPEG